MANAANSVINLTLAVTDRLSPAVQNVGKNILGLTQQVGNLSLRLGELGLSSASVAAQWTQSFLAIPTTLVSVNQLLDQSGFSLEKFASSLEDVSQYSFKDTLGGLGDVFGPLLTGIVPQIDAIAQKTRGIGRVLTDDVYKGLELIDKGVLSIFSIVEAKSKSVYKLTGNISGFFEYLSGVREPLAVFDALRSTLGGVSSGIFNAVQEIGFFSLGIQGLQQLVQTGPFQALIGQNEELRQQLLATQATLAGTSRVLQGGQEVSDPTKSIQALQGPVKQAIADLRQGSLDLVGVTSKDLVPIFQVVAGQITQIGGGLNDAKNLTLSFAAGLGTLGIPLFQANQEIRSIVQGTIDQNSVLAQSLNITNPMVERWKEQGILVQELTKRLEAFRSGNALAANSIAGIGSNIQEIFDEITRVAGEPLLQPIIDELDKIYKSLKTNSTEISNYIGGLAANAEAALLSLVQAGRALASSLGSSFDKIPTYLFGSLASGAKAFTEALTKTLVILQPFINLFAKLAESAIAAGGPFLTLFFQFKTLQLGVGVLTGAFGTLAQIIPGVGELMFLMTGRGNSLIGTFLGLKQSLGFGAAGFLLLGKNLASIPGLLGLVTKFIPLFGPQIAGLIPLISTFGIGLTAAGQKSAILREIFGKLGGQLPVVANAISGLAAANGLPKVAELFTTLGRNTDFAAVANQRFSLSMVSAGTLIRNFVVRTALMAGALVAVAFAVDKFILKNEAAMAGLQGFFGFLKDVSGAIFQFLTHPFTLATIAAGGLAVVIVGQTIPAIQALIATTLLGGLTGLATKLGALAGTLGGLKLAGMAASAAQASRGVTLLASAASSGSLGLAAFSQGLGAIALGLAGILAPLALVAAGITAIGLIRYTKDLKESGEAFEIYREQSNAVADDALAVAAKLKKAADRTAEAQKTGIALTAEEIDANNKLAQSGKLRVANLDEQIAILKIAAEEATGPYRESFQQQIIMLEATRRATQKYLDQVQILPRVLPKLGDTFTQLEAKATAAQKAISNPVGDVEVFKKKVEEYQKVTEEQVAIGAISYAEAERRYREISNLSTLEADAQIKASEAAINARKQQLKQETDLTAALVEQRKAAIAAGSVDEYKGYGEIFKLQQKDLKDQKKSTEELLIIEQKAGRGRGKLAKDLFLEKKSLETQLTTLATEELNKRIELENRYLSDAQAKIADTISRSEQSSLKQTQDLLNQNAVTQVQADRLRTNSTRDRLQKDLALELAYQQGLESLPQSKNAEKQEERERAIRASKLKTAQLTTQLSEQQQRDQEALTKVIQEQITKQQKGIQNLAERQNQAYTKQIELLGRLNTALEFQNKLIDARKGLQGAIGDYLQTEYKILIETAKTDEEKQRLTQKAAETELRFLGQRQALDRESLEVKLKIQKAEDARALAQNQVDQITSAAAVKSAQADLAKAKADPKTTPEELEALQLGIEAANAKLGAEQFKGQSLGAQTVFNQQQESTQRRTLALQQSGELDQKRFEYGKTLSPEQQEGFLNKLRNEIYQRLSKDKAIAPTGPTQNGPYTPTVYTGTFDAKTGVYTPSPESSTARTSRAVNVTSAELPQLKDLLQGTVNFSNILKEQVDFRPANKALEQLVDLSREGNGILLMVANDPKQEITSTTYNQTLERRDRSNRGLPR